MRSSHLTIFSFFLLFSIVLIAILPTRLAIATDMEPKPLTPADGAIVDCDPITGQAKQIVFSWTAVENSTEYQLQIVGNPIFNPTIFEVRVPTTTYDSAVLECAHKYSWRVRATKPIESQWSQIWAFTVKGGSFIDGYVGFQLLSPCNGCLGTPVQAVSFSWSPYKEATKYKFVLATDAAMTKPVI